MHRAIVYVSLTKFNKNYLYNLFIDTNPLLILSHECENVWDDLKPIKHILMSIAHVEENF